jgi:hypothetical protein
MIIPNRLLIALLLTVLSLDLAAKECWALSSLKGQTAASSDGYEFSNDKFPNPMVLCLDDDTGYVSGDDTKFMKFGNSTLAGWAENQGLELFEVYQIDRASDKVLFTKTRIGTVAAYPELGLPDMVGAYVGKATKIAEE